MPSLKEVYQEAVKRHGEDSGWAKALRDQMEAEKYRKGMSAQRLFLAGAGGRPPNKDETQEAKTEQSGSKGGQT